MAVRIAASLAASALLGLAGCASDGRNHPTTKPGTPVASLHDANSIAAFAIDDDPPAGGLSTRCKFQGVASNQDVYMCRARYEGDRITLRLEHERHGPLYRVTVLSDAQKPSLIGTIKGCTLSGNPNCPQ